MSQHTQIGTVATSVFTEDGYTKVVYHNTVVVKFNQDEIVLNSGGWFTATTKTRMNQCSNQFDLGFYVFQKDYQWFIDFQGETLEFKDNIRLERRI